MADKKMNPYANIRLEAIRVEIEAAVERAIAAERGGRRSRFRDHRRRRKESEALFR